MLTSDTRLTLVARLVYVLVALLNFSSTVGWAETVKISGLDFEVEQISALDDHNLKVLLLGESRVISRDKLQAHIVSSYFAHPEKYKAMSDEMMKQFIRRSIVANSPDLAAIALSAYIRAADRQPDDLIDLIREIGGARSAISSFEKILLEHDVARSQSRVVALMVLLIGIQDASWIRTNGTELIYSRGAILKELSQELFFLAVREKDFEHCKAIVSFVEQFWGLADPIYERLKVLLGRMQDLLSYKRLADLENILPIIELCRSDPQLRDSFRVILVEVLHSAASESLVAKKAEQSLSILSRIDVKWRTPRTHELVLRALEGIDADRIESFSDDAVFSLILAISLKDPTIQSKLSSLLDGLVRQKLSQGDLRTAEMLFSKLVQVRPDPFPDNDDIRIMFAQGYASLGLDKDAQNIMGNIRTSLSWSSRLRLLKSGYYIGFPSFIALISFPLIVATIFVLVNNALSRRQDVEKNGSEEFRSTRGEKFDGKLFSRFGLAQDETDLSAERDIYNRCLRVFGLEANASLDSIKAAYRAVVKDVHPDTHGQDPGTEISEARASERFLEVTEAYHQLLELRKRLRLD